MLREDWTRYIYTLNVKSNLKVADIKFNLVAEDFQGELNVTDLQLQEGSQVTAHVPHTSEMLKRVYHGINEYTFMNTVSNPVKIGVQPKIYTGLKNRFFNIVGRGHEVIVLPNVFHEDYMVDLLTSALDITLYAKEDFDLLRISTNDGALVPGRKYEVEALANHPLNYKYTREFYFDGAKAGEEIKLHANIFTASLNGRNIPLSQGTIYINGHPKIIARQRFIMAPFGSFRIRIEFYKQVNQDGKYNPAVRYPYLEDVGIGFYGWANFEQFKGGARY